MFSPPQMLKRDEVSNAPKQDIEFIEHDMPIVGLSRAFPETRIVQLSDLHRRGSEYDPLIRAAVARSNSTDPEYVFITGDFIDHQKSDVLPVVHMLGGLRAHRGIYAVLGNHDHRGDPVLLESALEAAGITVLNNRAVELPGGLWLAGVDDLLEGHGDLAGTLDQVPEGAPLILLSHIPNAFNSLPANRAMTVLSGHTHGGQVVLPFPTPKMVCMFHLRTRYVHGWQERGNQRMYINRGLGNTGWAWMARRVNCRPEVTSFAVHPA